MVLRSGIILPFQYRDAKKLLMVGVPEENRDLSIFDLKNVVRAAFGIYNFEFRNKKIGFNIPDELLLLYLSQRHDLTNFVLEVGQANDSAEATAAATAAATATSTKDPLCFEPSSSSTAKKRKSSAAAAPLAHIESNENSDDDQSSNLESLQPAHRMHISQIFSEPPASESYSQSADDSMDIIVPKSEIQEDFGESTDMPFQYASEFMASVAIHEHPENMSANALAYHRREPSWHAMESLNSDSVGFDIPTWGNVENLYKKEELQRLLEDKHKIIFGNFKVHQKLTNIERVKISKTIVQHLLADPKRTLSSKDLQNISELICQVFVGELPTTYYVKFSQGRHASGKMYDAYNNYRSSLAASGLITRRPRFPRTVVQTNAQLEMEQARRTEEQIAEEKAALQLLGIEDNFEKSIELWKKTFFHRQDEIIKARMPAAEYLKKYKILAKPNGYQLYIADVERKFKINVMLNMRDDFWQNMIERTKLVKTDYLLKIIELIRTEPIDAKKHIIALMVLPYLFPVSLKRGNQGITKPTKEDCAQTFICHFPDMKAAESGIQKHIAKATSNYDRLIQPVIVFVGHPVIEHAFVIVGEIRYAFRNIQDAITCAIAAYLALNLKYPTCSEKVWFFVQKYICNISTASDTSLENKVKTFAKDLNFL